jgi:hypothetical protein
MRVLRLAIETLPSSPIQTTRFHVRLRITRRRRHVDDGRKAKSLACVAIKANRHDARQSNGR